MAALVPALEVAASTPQLGLARSVLEARAQRLSRRLSLLAVLLAALAAVTVTLSARSLFAGFLALFLLLLAVAALTPAALKAGAELSARLLGRASPIARLALQEVAGSLSRTGVAIAALGMALTAMIGVAMMVESFRDSLREWLLQTLRADVYVTAPGPTDELARRLEPQVVQALLAVPGVRAHSEARRVVVGSDRGALDLNALRLGPQGERGFRLTQGQAHTVWPAWRSGALLISEPLAWRLGLNSGDTLTLTTASGPHAFTIAGVYREYGNDRGEVLMELATYQHFWRDEAIGGLGIYLEPQVSADAGGAGAARRRPRPPGAVHPLQCRHPRAVDAHLRAHLRHHARALLARRGRGGDWPGERAARLGARARARACAAAHARRDALGRARGSSSRRRSSWGPRRSWPRFRRDCSPHSC